MIPRDLNNPAYVFIPEDMADKIPALYSTEDSEDPVAILKFFTPESSWTWYLTEYDPEQRLAIRPRRRGCATGFACRLRRAKVSRSVIDKCP